MAEIISLVTNILTLLDFGCKVVSGTRSLRDSRHGIAPDVRELDLIIKHIQDSHQTYRTNISVSRKTIPGDDNTLEIMKECEELRKELSKVIEKLRMSDTAFSKTLETWRLSIRKIRKDKYLGTLRARLLELDKLVSSKIEQEMQEYVKSRYNTAKIRETGVVLFLTVDRSRHVSIMAQLKSIEKQKASLGVVTSSTLDTVHAEIMEIVRKNDCRHNPSKQRPLQNTTTLQGSATSVTLGVGRRNGKKVGNRSIHTKNYDQDTSDEEAEKEEMQLATQVQLLTNSIVKLELLQREGESSLKQIEVIRSLYFKEVFRRFEKIPEADPKSNEWVFDSLKTTMPSWLESGQENDSLYYIFGKAGSGKSTLMKFVSEDNRTRQLLERWAGTSALYTATYYFWNQGSEMQKSGVGLFQSLLYQILRKNPDLITSSWGNRPNHEVWSMQELRTAFQDIAKSTRFESKFCFFIDGLDEYEGEEEDLSKILEVLAAFKHIKICASSRPNRYYEDFMKREDRTFDIADFTKSDLENHARTELGKSEKFRRLSTQESDCAKIVTDISTWANGVWLWVYLVTSEIRKEVERGEGIETLRKIVDEFPSDLEMFFTRIIEKVKPRHKEQMAQIFLITVEELQPLPLHSFALLEMERTRPHFEEYAVKAKIESFTYDELMSSYPDLKKRLLNRCGDLLVVDDKPHPVCLSHSVDFLHRTVRDFLRDNYRKELQRLAKETFNPLISLSNICLALLKGAHVGAFRDPDALKTIIGLTDELLYYARELERRFKDSDMQRVVPILDELDKTNTVFGRRKGGNNHWTNVRDSPPTFGLDAYREGGKCNFLALAVQARLVGYVRTKLQTNPRWLNKSGRPLLDYALRPLRITPIAMPYHSVRDDPSVDVDMITLLLEHGADPNQPVYLHDGESVWGLFLISMDETGPDRTHKSLKEAWFLACRALIQAGARQEYTFTQCNLTVSSVLNRIFTASEVTELQREFAIKQKENNSQRSDGGWWSYGSFALHITNLVPRLGY